MARSSPFPSLHVRAALRVWLVAWTAGGTWLGCNALLGNESAVFDPSDGAVATVDATDDVDAGPGVEPTGTDASLDGGAELDAPDDVHDAGFDACSGVDLASNPVHCGACFHDCRGATCTGGRCDDVVIATSGVDRSSAMAADDTTVVWTDFTGGRILRAPLVGGDGGATTVYSADAGTFFGRQIAVAQNHVYFSSSTAILRCPLTGCATPSVVVGGRQNPHAVAALDDGTLAEAELDADGGVGRCTPSANDPCAKFDRVSYDRPSLVGLNATTVVFSTFRPLSDPEVVGATEFGAGERALMSGPNEILAPPAIGGDRVYVMTPNGLWSAPLDGSASAAKMVDLQVGDPGVATDATHVYFSTGLAGDQLSRCPLAQAPCPTPEAVQSSIPDAVPQILVRGPFVLFIEGNVTTGKIHRLVK